MMQTFTDNVQSAMCMEDKFVLLNWFLESLNTYPLILVGVRLIQKETLKDIQAAQYQIQEGAQTRKPRSPNCNSNRKQDQNLDQKP